MQVECPANVVTGPSGEPLCLDELSEPISWEPVEPVAIDFEQVAEPFSVGFLLMASCWALGKAVALVIGLVKR